MRVKLQKNRSEKLIFLAPNSRRKSATFCIITQLGMVKSLRLFEEEDGRDSRDSRDNSETEYHNFVRDLAVVSFFSVVSVVLKPLPYLTPQPQFLVRREQLTLLGVRLNFLSEGVRCNARQKCHRWVVLGVRPIGGTFC